MRLGTYSEASGIGLVADALRTGLQRSRVDVERMERAARPDERREYCRVVADAGRRVDRDVSLLECCPPEAVREAQVALQCAGTRCCQCSHCAACSCEDERLQHLVKCAD